MGPSKKKNKGSGNVRRKSLKSTSLASGLLSCKGGTHEKRNPRLNCEILKKIIIFKEDTESVSAAVAGDNGWDWDRKIGSKVVSGVSKNSTYWKKRLIKFIQVDHPDVKFRDFSAWINTHPWIMTYHGKLPNEDELALMESTEEDGYLQSPKNMHDPIFLCSVPLTRIRLGKPPYTTKTTHLVKNNVQGSSTPYETEKEKKDTDPLKVPLSTVLHTSGNRCLEGSGVQGAQPLPVTTYEAQLPHPNRVEDRGIRNLTTRVEGEQSDLNTETPGIRSPNITEKQRSHTDPAIETCNFFIQNIESTAFGAAVGTSKAYAGVRVTTKVIGPDNSSNIGHSVEPVIESGQNRGLSPQGSDMRLNSFSANKNDDVQGRPRRLKHFQHVPDEPIPSSSVSDAVAASGNKNTNSTSLHGLSIPMPSDSGYSGEPLPQKQSGSTWEKKMKLRSNLPAEGPENVPQKFLENLQQIDETFKSIQKMNFLFGGTKQYKNLLYPLDKIYRTLSKRQRELVMPNAPRSVNQEGLGVKEEFQGSDEELLNDEEEEG